MRHYLIKVGPALRVSVEDPRDQVTSRITDIDMVGKRIAVLLNSTISGFDIGSLEGWLPNNQSVNNDTERPNIDFIGVPRFALEHFRGYVVWCTANCSLFLTIKIKLGCKAKISQFDLHLVVKKQISQLQIPMNYPMLVQVFESIDDLCCVALHFKLVQALSPLQKFVHALVLTEF